MNHNVNTRTILATAVLAAAAALLVGPASATVVDVGSDGGRTPVTAPPTIQPGMIPYLSHGVGVDESLFSGQPSALEVDRAVAAANEAYDAMRVRSAITARQALFAGQQPAVGLTGDGPRTRGQVFQANTTFATGGDSGVDWTWVGFGAGIAALLAAAMGALYLSARHRDRVALP